MIFGNLIRNVVTKGRYDVKSSLSCVLRGSTFEGANAVGAHSEVVDSSVGYASYIAEQSVIRKALIGRFSSIGDFVRTGVGIHPIGRNVSSHPCFFNERISQRCAIPRSFAFEEHRFVDTYSKYYTKIGADVWVGNNVTIMDGITIADGCVIGLGSLVNRSTEPFGIYVGTPAKLIRFRFDEETRERLMEFCWWNRDLEWIRRNAPCFSDVEALLALGADS